MRIEWRDTGTAGLLPVSVSTTVQPRVPGKLPTTAAVEDSMSGTALALVEGSAETL